LIPVDVPEDRRAVLARVVNALVEGGFGFNSSPVEGLISMQRAWQGPGEDLVMVDVVTLDIQGQALAAREGDSGRPVWGPKRGAWSEVVAAALSQPAPHGYARVAPRSEAVPEAGRPRELLGTTEVCPVPNEHPGSD
jgi:hypothetical protein